VKKIIIIAVLLFVFGAFVVYEKSSSSSSIQKTTTLSSQIKAAHGQLIDVREPSEYVIDHANGAINVPLSDILNGNLLKIDKTKPVYVYCRTGKRALQAKTALEQTGYKNVTSIGGLSNWQNQGGTVCASSKPTC
jgi:rhodanese-related sulfurtransferase